MTKKEAIISILLPLGCLAQQADHGLEVILIDSEGAQSQAPEVVLESYSETTHVVGLDAPVVTPDVFPVSADDFEVVTIEKRSVRVAEMDRLAKLAPTNIRMKGLPLNAAINLLASQCSMNFFSLPEGSGGSDNPVTIRLNANPYAVLQKLCANYGIGMEFKASESGFGVWQFFRINPYEMITRNYTIRFDNLQNIKSTPPQINATLGSIGTGAGGGITGGGITGGGIAGGGGGAGSFNDVFEVQKDVIVKEVEKILATPVTGLNAQIVNGDDMPAVSPTTRYAKTESNTKGTVFYAADSNRLVVTATRQHHELVANFLNQVDQPEQLIRITARFVETNLNPVSDLGIDWSGVSGANLTASGLSSNPMNFNDAIVNPYPSAALLSMSDLQWQLNFLETDSNSNLLQEPVVVTENNQQVALKTVTQIPVQQGQTQGISSATSTVTSNVTYLEIGTIINIYPTVMDGSFAGTEGAESVKLGISLVISTRLRDTLIQGNEYPVIASRNYDYTVTVPNGYTLAIGGLSEQRDQESANRVPVLGDIPVLGELLFGSSRNEQDKRNLIAYITPEIIDSAADIRSGITVASNSPPPAPEQFDDIFEELEQDQDSSTVRSIKRGRFYHAK